MRYELFRGYIPTRDKASLIPFKRKSSKLMTYEQVKNLPEFGGVLNEATILVDIDNKEESDILLKIVKELKLKCKVYQTRRGKHFYFINSSVDSCKTGTKLAIGITADIKIGAKNSYAILKYENSLREVLYDTELYQPLPSFLLPVKANVDFTDMKNGEGRNSAMFKYILTLQNHNLQVENIKTCIRLINKYIFKDPLDEHELEVILRDDAFQKPTFFENNKFLFDKFANFLINDLNIIKINGQLHLYKNGIYINSDFLLESKMIEYIPGISKRQRSEVLAYIDVSINKNSETAPPHLIAFKNGIYDLQTDTLKPFSPDIIIINRIPWNFNREIYSQVADDTLNKIACNDKEIRSILEECIGSCFYASNTLGGGKAFILTGEGANGKSTFLTIIQNILGESNISSLDLKELDVKFQNAELFGKLANIGDDISDEFIVNPSIFKKLVTGNRIQVQRKGERPFEFNNHSKLLFSANCLPRIKDKTGAVLRRLVIIPFKAKFTPDDSDYDPTISYKLQSEEVMEYVIQLGIQGLQRVIKNRQYTKSALVQKELEEYNEMNNPLLMFFKEIDEDEILNEPTNKVYQDIYYPFCLNNGFKPLATIEFSRQITKYYACNTIRKYINGKRIHIFSR